MTSFHGADGIDTDHHGQPEGLKCPICGHLTDTSQAYAEHKLTHGVEEGDIITEEAMRRSGETDDGTPD